MIDALIERMQALLEPLQAADDPRQYFHATYLRTTIAVAEAIRGGGFIDPEWAERWDVTFASLYLDALEVATSGGQPTRPWQIAFGAPRDLPALNHVLLGMNAHINFDLPQALVTVITDEEFDAPALVAKREEDHRAIDRVLAARVAAEDDELAQRIRARIRAQPAAAAAQPAWLAAVPARVAREGLGQRDHAQPGPPPGARHIRRRPR